MKIVDAGATFLDLVKPGWEKLIDLDKLDLSTTCDCVLGQIYGKEHPHSHRDMRYFKALDELGLSEDREAGRLGFIEYGRARFRNMTVAWAEAVRERLSV